MEYTNWNIQYQRVRVWIASPKKVKNEQDRLTGERKRNFKIAAARSVGRPDDAFLDWEIHHLHPLGLGGTSDPRNLVVIDKEDHLEAHEKIASKIKGLSLGGQKRYINIPYPKHPTMNFPMVWNIQDFLPLYAFGNGGIIQSSASEFETAPADIQAISKARFFVPNWGKKFYQPPDDEAVLSRLWEELSIYSPRNSSLTYS